MNACAVTDSLKLLRSSLQADREFIKEQLRQYQEYLSDCAGRFTDVANIATNLREDEPASLSLSPSSCPTSSSGSTTEGGGSTDTQHEILLLKEQLSQKDRDILQMKAVHDEALSLLRGELQRATDRCRQAGDKIDEEKGRSGARLEDLQRQLDAAQKSTSDAVARAVTGERERVSELENKLKKASELLVDLLKKHEGEVKAVRNAAHVKDLCKIASLREITIQRDKLISDAKCYK
jgi:uncharacterized phage infection (PIP) family protein YhgE